MSVLLSSGCHEPRGRLALDEPAQLEQRALALLLRAGHSELDVVRVHALEALVDVAPDAGLPAFREALTSETPLVRHAGCVALGETRDRASLKAIRHMLADPDARVRLAAAFAAHQCGDTNQAGTLVGTLNDHPDEKVRAEAAYLIGELGEPKALRRLKLAARRENSSYVVVHIESAMAKLGDRASLDRLVQYALKSDAVTIVLALQTLIELADPGTQDTLKYRLYNKADYLQTRLMAARGLGKLGIDDGYKPALKALAYETADENETMQVRENAALALGAIGDPRALPALRQLAEMEDDPRTQVAACYAICQIVRASSER